MRVNRRVLTSPSSPLTKILDRNPYIRVESVGADVMVMIGAASEPIVLWLALDKVGSWSRDINLQGHCLAIEGRR